MVKPQTLTFGQLKILNHLARVKITLEQAEEIADRLKPFNLLPLEKGSQGKVVLLTITGRELEKKLSECFFSSFTIKARVEVNGSSRRITAKASCLEGLFTCIKKQIDNLV